MNEPTRLFTGLQVPRLIEGIVERPGHPRLVAVDGPGGSGKSTFASLLSAACCNAPVVHTDDFASADNPIDWWPRLLDQVVRPLSRGEAARYQRYDWPTDQLAEWHDIDPDVPIVIIEGVTAGRLEWSELLAFTIWIDTPRIIRLARGIERDGAEALKDWNRWMAQEDAHYAADRTRERADRIVDGA